MGRNESIEEFLKRGGKINQIPEGAHGTKQPEQGKEKPKRKHKKKDYCEQCEKREICQTPPELKEMCRKMERLLSKTVDVKQKEEPLTEEYERLCPKAWPTSPNLKKTIISMFFYERKTQTNIAKTLGISQQYVSEVIVKYRASVLQNQKK